MADEPKGEQLLHAAGEDGLRLPVVITEGGETLVEPTDAELADMLGSVHHAVAGVLRTVVIGGGPAGLAAAVYGASEGLRTVLIERTATGGQAGQQLEDRELPRLPDGVLGRRAGRHRARRQAERFGAELITARKASRAGGQRIQARTVRFDDGGSIDAHAVILATGVAYRQLQAPEPG